MEDANKRALRRILSILEFRMRNKSGSHFWGKHKSIFKGQGMHFQNIRQYQPGDDVKRIDWKVTARKAKAYVREYELESEMDFLLLVDISSSMYFGHNDLYKSHKAMEIVSYLAQIVTGNEDRFGLLYDNDSQVKILKPRKGKQNLQIILKELANIPIRAGRKGGISKSINHVLKHYRKRSGVVIVSDFAEEMRELQIFINLITKLTVNHDVFLIQVLDPFEINPGELRGINLGDLEHDASQFMDLGDKRNRGFSNYVTKLVETFHAGMRKNGVRSTLVYTDSDALEGITKLFKKDKRLYKAVPK